ncbi:GNAT family N-acetyltransferase [Hymenobacter baengnokdamensis]|uniref:GNAT family N-acetyltransferase n=1 Tax=Hymenobacter baengnokdamensis TaxID=2615203 RepID=UPI00177AE276|nr:GNAT family N-acetyltransferase [Hymenobacter baengnokdamensis]
MSLFTPDWQSVNLSGLLPATQHVFQRWLLRQTANSLAFTFPYQSLASSARLTYELVDWLNFPIYLTLFAGDPSPFVDARFKERSALEMYAVALLTELRFSRKHGACDWLVRRRSDEQAIGVLHLYELNHEIINDQPAPCVVGMSLAAPFRQQGYGLEAFHQLLAHTTSLFGRPEARALTAASNLAAQQVLRKSSFLLLEEYPATPRQGAMQLWQRHLCSHY